MDLAQVKCFPEAWRQNPAIFTGKTGATRGV